MKRERSLQRRCKDALRYRLFRQNWTIGVVRRPIAEVAGLCGGAVQRRALEAVHWMPEQRGLFRADPFPVSYGGTEDTIRILFEELHWSEGRGKIAACTYDGRTFGKVDTVLECPHHLSYPFSLLAGDRWLTVPEQAEAGEVRAYDLAEGQDEEGFPIARMGLIDPSIIEHGGRWWMFAGHRGENENKRLHLYHSDALTGPWTPHPANPVKSDATSARPAGHLFRHEGALYRPGQNCADHYGQGIAVHRVLLLDEERYEEEQVAEVVPLSSVRYRDGLHTISAFGPYTVIDGARLESTLHPALDGLAALVR